MKITMEMSKGAYREESFIKAKNAVQKHIDYYSTLGKGNLTGLQEIIDQMR